MVALLQEASSGLVRQEVRRSGQAHIDSKVLIGESVSHRAKLYVAFERQS